MIISFSLLNFHNQQGYVYYFSTIISFIAHYFLLNLLVGLLAYCFSFVFNEKIVIVFMIFFSSLFQLILLFDTKIYNIFHYHINPLVLNVITTEGVSDSVIIGKGTVAVFFLFLAGILCAEIIMHWYFSNINKTSKQANLVRIKKISKAFFLTGLFLIGADKVMYAYGDIVNNTAITQNAKLFPLYQPFTIKRFASKVFHIQVNRELNFKVSAANTNLHYPKNALRFDPSIDRKFNIIILVVDGLRFDMGIQPEQYHVQQSLQRWKRNTIRNIFTALRHSGNLLAQLSCPESLTCPYRYAY
jgi:membrane-anchored protein YejM (alkaline phosphatase superfamily)